MIKVNGKVIQLNQFPDGTLNIKSDGLFDDEVIISWHYRDDSEFMAVAFLTKHYQDCGNEVSLYMPYVPNARMDRVESEEDIFTLKYFGELINSLGFKRVFIMDAHSNVSTAVIKNCVYIKADCLRDAVLELFTEEGKEFPIMFFPDEGAMKRYSKSLSIPFAFGMKNRDWKTGQILGLEVMGMSADEIKGKDILIQDDICSKGGTFYYAAKKLKEMGANDIYLLVTHCEDSIHKGEFGNDKVNLLETGLIKHIFTTDSTYNRLDSDMISVARIGLGYVVGCNNECKCKCGGENHE